MCAIRKSILILMYVSTIFAELPPSKKCKLDDTDCMRAAAQDAVSMFAEGINEIGTEPLDVMKIDSIKIDLAGLKLDTKNTDVKGLKKTVIEKVSVDMKKKQLEVVYRANITMKGVYTAGGRLLILPISGDGDYSIKLKNLRISLTMPFELIKGANEKDVIDLKSFKYKFDEDHVHFQFNNLFNGNKVLADAMLKFMNDNWKLLTNEFGPVIFQKTLDKIFKAVKIYLRTVPLENIIEK